ncbi:hypothetical protein A0H81_12941 [Grifola frondosa]|uniref:Uncharacterized protein n=1 Tax=Grifola frondosa TaxID=5627 RepID=A0A1C7LWA6_GRIFR|nr:hypothetical protein A0H81_12941 [Grifola frondosa]
MDLFFAGLIVLSSYKPSPYAKNLLNRFISGICSSTLIIKLDITRPEDAADAFATEEETYSRLDHSSAGLSPLQYLGFWKFLRRGV